MIKQSVKFLLIFLTGAIVVFGIYHYKNDLPLDHLIEKYTYADSDFIQVDGLDIHYRKTGSGPVLLLIHGFGANLRNWESWHDILSDQFTTISLDLPGYGLTGPWEDRIHSNSSHVQFLEEFVESLSLDSFFLAGNSMGGGIAWNYALQFPKRVRKMILINSAGYPSDKTENDGVLGFKILRIPVINQLATRITPRFVLKKSIQAVYADPSKSTENEVDTYMDLMRRKGNRQVLVERMTSVWEDNSSEIKNIRIPTLIIWGAQDQVIDVKYARKFYSDIPASELIIYEDLGHVPMIEAPALSAGDAKRFLNKSF